MRGELDVIRGQMEKAELRLEEQRMREEKDATLKRLSTRNASQLKMRGLN